MILRKIIVLIMYACDYVIISWHITFIFHTQKVASFMTDDYKFKESVLNTIKKQEMKLYKLAFILCLGVVFYVMVGQFYIDIFK